MNKIKENNKNIGIIILATNAYFVLGIKFIKRFMHYYHGEYNITFYFFSDTNPIDYLPNNINIKYTHTTNNNWVDGTNLKFSSILSLTNNCSSDYLFYFDADTNVNHEFTEEWFLGNMVGGQHFADLGWMKTKKGFDRNPLSQAYVPLDTKLPQMYYYGAFFGGTTKNVFNFCNIMLTYQLKDREIPYEPGVNDESYINKYFHYNSPTKTILAKDFKFAISDKGGLGDTRFPDLDVNEIKKELRINKNKLIDINNCKVIVYDNI